VEVGRQAAPRQRVGAPLRSSEVTTFLGGASIVRRDVLTRVGSFPEDFFFGHEETSLAWRALDAGYRLHYDADLIVHHPSMPPSRHDHFHYLTSRNRVWLARTHLPLPLAVAYGVVWLALTLARAGSLSGCRQVVRGFRDGLTHAPAAPREPIRWRTVWRMSRLGRPPII
jgi:GT2 family glycosyltransferase